MKAIVTGATSGIGKATAKLLAQSGARVVAVGRNQQALGALAKETECGIVAGDLTEHSSCEKIIAEAVEQLGGLTTLCNVAGVLYPGAMGADSTDV